MFFFPTVEDQCIPEGVDEVHVGWEEITANGTGTNNITCTDSLSQDEVPLTGTCFSEGTHTITCSVNGSNGVTYMDTFAFSVIGTDCWQASMI